MAHDRQYRTLSLSPKVIMVDDVLTPDECDQMVARGTNMPPSEQIHANAESEKIYTNYRTSGTASLPDDAFVLGVRQRVLRLAVLLKPDVAFLSRRQRAPQLGLREQIARGEGLQLVRYHPGQWFKKHTDYFDHSVGWRTSTDVHAYTRARARVCTALTCGLFFCCWRVLCGPCTRCGRRRASGTRAGTRRGWSRTGTQLSSCTWRMSKRSVKK